MEPPARDIHYMQCGWLEGELKFPGSFRWLVANYGFTKNLSKVEKRVNKSALFLHVFNIVWIFALTYKLIPGDEDIPLNDVGGSVVEEEEEEEEVNKLSDVDFETSKID